MAAELLLRGGTIYTLDPRAPRAQSLAVAGGKLVAVDTGSLDELIGPDTRVVQLRGRAVVPGFVDAHIHFGSFALSKQQVDLDPAPVLQEGLRIVEAFSRTLPPGAWLRGRGWDRNRWGRLPTAKELDSAIGPRPAALASHDGHSVWLSTAALQAVGVNRNTADPPGGVIERDESGAPTGVLFENAQDLIRGRIPKVTSDELRDAIGRALPLAAAAGLTGIHNLEDHRSRQAFQELESNQELTLRVYHGVARGELREAVPNGIKTGTGSDWLRIGPVKLFADGALGSRTAHLLEPYEGRVADGYRGVPTLQPEELEADMRSAADAELDLAVHAIGDAAVRSVLDAYEKTCKSAPLLTQRMLRIEHAQLVHPDDVPRFQRMHVIASMQPIHAAADWRAADAHWGQRCRHAYAWRDLLESGATLAFGTDAPVEAMEPLENLSAATTRVDPSGEPANGWYPEQRLPLHDAVKAYTLGSATAERANSRGALRVNNDADFVVLSLDPFQLPPEALRETRVELTVVGGKTVFQNES